MDRDRGQPFRIRAYAIRRFVRIYPAFAVCLLLCFGLGHIASSDLLQPASASSVLAHLGLISSFSVEHRDAVNGVLWSVVAECHFYILYGLLWRWFDGPRRTACVVGMAVAVSLLTYLGSVMLWPQGPVRVMVQTTFLATWWTWCIGALVAEWVHLGPRPWLAGHPRFSRVLLAGCLLLSLAIGLMPHPMGLHLRRFALPLTAALFLYLLLNEPQGGRWSRPLMALGTISYSLYLFHPVAIWLGVQFAPGVLSSGLLILLLGGAMALLSYRFVEMRFIAVGRNILANRLKAFQNVRAP